MSNGTPEKTAKVRIGRIDEFRGYEVTEEELQRISTGGDEQTYLSFGLSLLSIATSFVASLIVGNFELYPFLVLVVIVIIGFVLGLFFMVQWWLARKARALTVSEVRKRLKDDASTPPSVYPFEIEPGTIATPLGPESPQQDNPENKE